MPRRLALALALAAVTSVGAQQQPPAPVAVPQIPTFRVTRDLVSIDVARDIEPAPSRQSPSLRVPNPLEWCHSRIA